MYDPVTGGRTRGCATSRLIGHYARIAYVRRADSTVAYGRKTRQVRDSAFSGHNARMSAMWGTVLAATAMHGQMLQTNRGLAGSLSAANSSMDHFNAEVQAQGETYLSRLAPSVAALGNASVNVVETTVTLPINDQAALRKALRGVYASRKNAP
jgi:hypothetical protein